MMKVCNDLAAVALHSDRMNQPSVCRQRMLNVRVCAAAWRRPGKRTRTQ